MHDWLATWPMPDREAIGVGWMACGSGRLHKSVSSGCATQMPMLVAVHVDSLREFSRLFLVHEQLTVARSKYMIRK